jgi:glycosyltransferase involved in cell wall biosynthesis
MIIGYDAKRAFCNRRGLGNFSRDIIRLMSHYYSDNHYFLFTPSDKKALFPLDESCVTTLMPTKSIDKFVPAFWRSYGLLKDIKSNKMDIYHGLSQELPFGIRSAGIKSIVTIHDAIFVRYPELYDPYYRFVFTQKNRYSCHVADRIVAISEQTKRDCIEFFNADEKKIDVVYQGCNAIFRNEVTLDDMEFVRNKYGLPQQFLLTVGAIERRKNMGIILDAMHQCKMDVPLVIVGCPTSYIQELHKKITDYSLDSQVVFLHRTAFEDFPAMYHAASCMIYPSLFEGFGLPILEALCTGTPVITSRGGCFEETGGDAALYIDPLKADELAETIQRVLFDSGLRKEMIAKGLQHAELFADERVAHSMMQIYANLMME